MPQHPFPIWVRVLQYVRFAVQGMHLGHGLYGLGLRLSALGGGASGDKILGLSELRL